MGSTSPSVMYVLFTSGPDDRLIEDCRKRLKLLREKLGLVKSFGVYMTYISITPTEHYKQFNELAPGPETAELMRIALQEPEHLFDFAEPVVTELGPEAITP